MRSFIKALTFCALIAYCSGIDNNYNGNDKNSVSSAKSNGGSQQLGNAFADNIQCYTCSGTPSECYNTSSSMTCNGNGQFVCYTEYTNYGSQVSLRCFNDVACANQEVKNEDSCYTSNIASVKTCTFCCNTSLCNSVPLNYTSNSAGRSQRADVWSLTVVMVMSLIIATIVSEMAPEKVTSSTNDTTPSTTTTTRPTRTEFSSSRDELQQQRIKLTTHHIPEMIRA